MFRSHLLSIYSLIRPVHSSLPLLIGLFTTAPASAVQPLNTFLDGARSEGFDAREQRATVDQRKWEAQSALGRLLPALTAQGSITHNQYKAELPPGTFPGQTDAITITPQNQWDATFRLDVPLVDLAQASRYGQAKHLAQAAEAQQDVVSSDLDRLVAQSYYTYLGATALVEASQRSLKIAEENFELVKNRNELGAATSLDLERARANVERAKRDQTDAELVGITAARNLETVSGITPLPVTEYPIDDLHHEAPLAEWMAAKDTPSDRVQRELDKAAHSGKRAAARALLPTLSANATERISNATGFTGQASSYSLQALLSWRLDYATYSTAQAQASAAAVQKIRAERARRGVEDSIFEAHHRVEASIAKSASARAEAEASEKAAFLAMERYQAGALTQLEVTESQRDAFLAQAARVKADADLAFARILLRISSGKAVEVPASTSAAAPIRPLDSSSTKAP